MTSKIFIRNIIKKYFKFEIILGKTFSFYVCIVLFFEKNLKEKYIFLKIYKY